MKANAVLVLMLLACSCDGAPTAEERSASLPAESDRRVVCATGGTLRLEPVCSLEMQDGPEGTILVIRAPDGGFRRLLITKDGRGVSAADGAEPAVVKPLGERLIEVSIGGDRYRLPATVAS